MVFTIDWELRNKIPGIRILKLQFSKSDHSSYSSKNHLSQIPVLRNTSWKENALSKSRYNIGLEAMAEWL